MALDRPTSPPVSLLLFPTEVHLALGRELTREASPAKRKNLPRFNIESRLVGGTVRDPFIGDSERRKRTRLEPAGGFFLTFTCGGDEMLSRRRRQRSTISTNGSLATISGLAA